MAPERGGPPGERGGLLAPGLVWVDEREMKRTRDELVAEIPFHAAHQGGFRHRNATARNANRATVIATLLMVCS